MAFNNHPLIHLARVGRHQKYSNLSPSAQQIKFQPISCHITFIFVGGFACFLRDFCFPPPYKNLIIVSLNLAVIHVFYGFFRRRQKINNCNVSILLNGLMRVSKKPVPELIHCLVELFLFKLQKYLKASKSKQTLRQSPIMLFLRREKIQNILFKLRFV